MDEETQRRFEALEQKLAGMEDRLTRHGIVEGPPDVTYWNDCLFRTIDVLDPSVRVRNILQEAGIFYVWQLVELTDAKVLKMKNCGRKQLNEMKELLQNFDLEVNMRLYNFPKHLFAPPAP
jgi:DNA-directed RNA polymerase subunit alpha